MELKESEGDITESGCDAIVNTVNCVGVMGGGAAKAIKDKYPWCLAPYKDACEKEILQPGGVFVVCIDVSPKIEYPMIINIATKNHWRGRSRIKWVDKALDNLSDYLSTSDITSVAIPRPGCGLGGLDWDEVKPLVETHLGGLDCQVTIHHKEPEDDEVKSDTIQTTLLLEEE